MTTTNMPERESREAAAELLGDLLHQIAPEVDLAGADRSAPMQDELDLDSMDFLNLVAALHRTTGIDVPEADYARIATVDGFVGYVAERLGHADRAR
jgi:acyl carrier protein